MEIDPRRFRDVMGCFATGVTVATARRADGTPVGVTINAFASVSLAPPLVLFCLERSAACYGDFAAAPAFAVNMLADDQRALSDRFAGLAPDRWDGVALADHPDGPPLLAGTLASVVARREAVHPGGDHGILVGRVTALVHDPARRPLLYWRSGYRQIGAALGPPTCPGGPG